MLDSITTFAVQATASQGPADAADIYRALTSRHPNDVEIEQAIDFDRHVFACVLSAAASEGGDLAARCGLDDVDLAHLLQTYFPGRHPPPSIGYDLDESVDPEEFTIVRDLLSAYRSSGGLEGRWLCGLIARRALEPNHLWEDLGLRSRAELSRLMSVHFQPLFARNTQNMRWKRFIYRLMCEDDGFAMCSTPVCSNCSDYSLCFGIEGGVSRLATAVSPP